ncbi:branched-chain amino acid aminotransferase [Tamlana sedimentorum]|uniref:Branched-chain amino acid aminotransferase n=1 Tax=Neotamlana sedimentorum TaxID=1435349 RepID=A0A0D7WAM5_9FLAO|nr:DUF4920 domain-containing protein [Tamlana sedimentorum]KJD35723.1 branched-chain amino acid aminotransferase [Tamlana sedimentorum]
MKYFRLLIICILLLNSCKKKSEEQKQAAEEIEIINYESFGKEIIADDAVAAKSMAQHYKSMPVGDSINSKMIAKVTDVCQAKGCWMTLDLEDGSEVMVKFKDYGFFVPKDIKGQDVIINGKAFVSEISVDEQQHYAKDAGKSEAEIALIKEPKKTFSFEADGVLVVQ